MNTIYDDIDLFAKAIHEKNVEAGWWDDLEEVQKHLPTQELKDLVEAWFLATKIALIHSEASEMLEGLRKGLKDDHLPHLSMEDVEASDIFLRLLDYCGRRKFGLGTTMLSKGSYNLLRPDHDKTLRKKGGVGVKKF